MLELPEDVMGAETDEVDPLRRRRPVSPEPAARELLKAADLIRTSISPVVLAGNGVVRARAAPALREFCRATGIAVAETFMGKGLVDAYDSHALGTVGLHTRDYAMAGFEDADLVIAIGYDLVEHAPSHWNPRKDKKIVVVDSQPAEIDEFFQPEVELVGDIYHVLTRLAEECRDVPHSGGSHRLREVILGRLQAAREDDGFPMQPPRALWEIRQALGREDILISDVGLHKLWIGRMFPAHEPNTVLIANGLAGMGFALPCAIAAKLVHPERRVITVNGDGGFLMNCQELETAMRLKTPIVNVVWENHQYGSIVWKQDRKFGEHFGDRLHEPRLRPPRRGVRHARVPLRGRRRLRPPPPPRIGARRAVADRHADRLLDRRRDQRGARHRDRRDVVLRFDLPSGAHLRLLEESDADEQFALIDRNRAHLAPWMPWVPVTRSRTTRSRSSG